MNCTDGYANMVLDVKNINETAHMWVLFLKKLLFSICLPCYRVRVTPLRSQEMLALGTSVRAPGILLFETVNFLVAIPENQISEVQGKTRCFNAMIYQVLSVTGPKQPCLKMVYYLYCPSVF